MNFKASSYVLQLFSLGCISYAHYNKPKAIELCLKILALNYEYTSRCLNCVKELTMYMAAIPISTDVKMITLWMFSYSYYDQNDFQHLCRDHKLCSRLELLPNFECSVKAINRKHIGLLVQRKPDKVLQTSFGSSPPFDLMITDYTLKLQCYYRREKKTQLQF